MFAAEKGVIVIDNAIEPKKNTRRREGPEGNGRRRLQLPAFTSQGLHVTYN
jgi:hypothetical protein